MRTVVPAIGCLALAAACATTGSNASGVPRFTPAPETHEYLTPVQFAAQRDSAAAQHVADQVGPGASIRADFTNVSGVRRVTASFHVDADAYVMVGHIDADGVLRIVFPLDPRDDGFVKGNRDYRTPEFFAGFSSQYRVRAQQLGLTYAARAQDSYDGQLGYAFIVASWRPLKLDQFATDGRWDSFELADPSYLDDPRPAIYELASLLAGTNREAYTVAFARYANSNMQFAGYGSSSAFGYGAFGGFQYCSGFDSFGYSSLYLFSPAALYGLGYSGVTYRRGQYYYYDELQDCYRSAYPAGYNPYGYRVAGFTQPTSTPVPTRGIVPRDRAPVPTTPAGFGNRTLPVTRVGATDSNGNLPVSPTYRERGLITPSDGPVTMPGRRTPVRDAHVDAETHTRPSIQDMVSRRPQTPVESQPGWVRAETIGRPRAEPSSYTPANNGQQTYTPPSRRAEPSTEQRSFQPASREPRQEPRQEQPRTYQPPQVESRPTAPVVREAPAARETPVVREAPSRPTPPPEVRTPAPERSAPPAAPPASSSPPATGSRPPGPPGR